jgi:hypothetical protein
MEEGDVHPSAFPFTMERVAAKGAGAESFVWWSGNRKHVSTCNLEEWF